MATSQGALPTYLGTLGLQTLRKNWWVLMLRGLIAILFGVLTFVWPGMTILALALLYAAYALADGVLSIMAAVTGSDRSAPTWWLVVVGGLGIAAGVVTFLWPSITALVFVVLIGTWALLRGILEVAGAIALRKEIENEWTLIAIGVASIIFGLWVLFAPSAGLLALVWVIGTYAILAGLLMVGLSLRLKNLGGVSSATRN